MSTNRSCAHSWRPSAPRQEVQIQTRNQGAEGDPAIPTNHRPAAAKASLCPAGKAHPPLPFRLSTSTTHGTGRKLTPEFLGPRGRNQLQTDWRGVQVAVASDPGPAGGRRGLPRAPLRGRQPVRHPRQEGHHHAEGHPAGEADTRGLGRRRRMMIPYPLGTEKKSNNKE